MLDEVLPGIYCNRLLRLLRARLGEVLAHEGPLLARHCDPVCNDVLAL